MDTALTGITIMLADIQPRCIHFNIIQKNREGNYQELGKGAKSMTILTKPSTVRLAANAATFLLAVTIILQLLLVAGILPITMAWGGRQDVLTASLRIASLAAVVFLGSFIYVIRRRAGLIGVAPPSTFNKILAWIVTGFLALNTLGNLSSHSRLEMIVFTPITFLLVVSCLVVSISKSDNRSSPNLEIAPTPEELTE